MRGHALQIVGIEAGRNSSRRVPDAPDQFLHLAVQDVLRLRHGVSSTAVRHELASDASTNLSSDDAGKQAVRNALTLVNRIQYAANERPSTRSSERLVRALRVELRQPDAHRDRDRRRIHHHRLCRRQPAQQPHQQRLQLIVAVMPGGDVKAWPHVAPILQAIAAKAPDGIVGFYKRQKLAQGKKVAKDVLRVYRQTAKGKS